MKKFEELLNKKRRIGFIPIALLKELGKWRVVNTHIDERFIAHIEDAHNLAGEKAQT